MSAPPEIPPQTRLLKARDARGLGSKVVFNFEDLRGQGDAYVDAVRKQAREIVEQARREAETIRREALDQGFDQGRQAGLKQATELIDRRAGEIADRTAHDNLATLLPAMKAAADAIALERDRWLAEWESTAVRLAAAIAEKLLKQHLHLRPEAGRDMVRSALELAAGTPRIKVRLHPDDAATLGAQATEVVRTLASCGEAEIVADASLTRGGCFIETQHGTIDGRVETLLERIVCELSQGNN